MIWHYVNDYAWEVEDWSAIGGGGWPQESTSANNYWNRWLMAPNVLGGMGGGINKTEDSVKPEHGDTTNDDKVVVPISGDESAIHVGVTVEGTKATIDEVDLRHLDTVIGDHVDTGTVTIDFSALESEEPITTVEIPAAAIKQIANAVSDPANDAHSLEIVLSDGVSIEFDAVALSKKASQVNGLDITISIEHSDDVHISNAQKNAIGNRPAYDINVTSGSKHISDMGGKITVFIDKIKAKEGNE